MNTHIDNIPIEQHPLQPFLPPAATLLLLGSFPPPKHRWCMNFFYPNRTNTMWEIFGIVFYGDSHYFIDSHTNTYKQRLIEDLLRQKGIAVFDTAQAVKRMQNNASDKYLQVVQKTDIPLLLQQIPLCSHIICTGQKSALTLCEDYNVKVPPIGQSSTFYIQNRLMTLHRVPSSSRAYPMPITQKAMYYEQLFRNIGLL